MPVRSATLAHGTVSVAGWHGLFFVPQGWTYLVKAVEVGNLGSAHTTLRLWTALAGTSSLVAVFEVEVGTIGTQAPWLALTEGTELAIQHLAAVETSLWISGSQLPGVQEYAPVRPTLRLG